MNVQFHFTSASRFILGYWENGGSSENMFEPLYEKSNNLQFCETKGADQLCSNCTVDQRLCFHYTDSIDPLLLDSKISIF